jgi:hypothetical protein
MPKNSGARLRSRFNNRNVSSERFTRLRAKLIRAKPVCRVLNCSDRLLSSELFELVFMVFFLCSAVRLRSVALHPEVSDPTAARVISLNRAPRSVPRRVTLSLRATYLRQHARGVQRKKDLKSGSATGVSINHLRAAGESGRTVAPRLSATGHDREVSSGLSPAIQRRGTKRSEANPARGREVGRDCAARVKWSGAETPESGVPPRRQSATFRRIGNPGSLRAVRKGAVCRRTDRSNLGSRVIYSVLIREAQRHH